MQNVTWRCSFKYLTRDLIYSYSIVHAINYLFLMNVERIRTKYLASNLCFGHQRSIRNKAASMVGQIWTTALNNASQISYEPQLYPIFDISSRLILRFDCQNAAVFKRVSSQLCATRKPSHCVPEFSYNCTS